MWQGHVQSLQDSGARPLSNHAKKNSESNEAIKIFSEW